MTTMLVPEAPVHWVVVAAEPVTNVDVTASDMINAIDDTLHASGIDFMFCRDERSRKGQAEALRPVYTRVGEQTFGTIHEAVSA